MWSRARLVNARIGRKRKRAPPARGGAAAFRFGFVSVGQRACARSGTCRRADPRRNRLREQTGKRGAARRRCGACQAAAGPPASPAPHRMEPARILLVEDDPVARLVLRSWLEQRGATVVAADGPTEAGPALRAGQFDVVLSDIHMPGNDGLEWVESILREDCPPVVLMTGNPQLATAQRAANLPVAAYLVKPPDFAALGELLDRLLAEARQRRTLRAVLDEVRQLLADPPRGATAPPNLVLEKLALLAPALQQVGARDSRRPGRAVETAAWRAAVADAIAVIGKTKDNFRSKELAGLRARLQQLLETGKG
ncbi:MAG: response regulator [Opitutae bacterium]|nr:response regulator [Opitutae bacterium]